MSAIEMMIDISFMYQAKPLSKHKVATNALGSTDSLSGPSEAIRSQA
jgi:hypothetical protein